MVPGSAQNWIAVKCKFNNPTSTKEMKTKTMTTLHLRKSIGRSPCRGAFLLIPLAIATLGLTLIFNPVAASADPEVFEASGATPADIQTAVDAFRNFLGDNNGVGGTFPTGRREINWDGVPDAFSAPNLLPANFFNSNSPRGVVFFTPGTGFQVSANSINPTNTPVRFGNINPVYPALFSTFSPQKLFSALQSKITETLFFIPGTTHSATVKGFGAVFTDVNDGHSTKIEYFDVTGK